jgi:PAS domain S-box-containing protein
VGENSNRETKDDLLQVVLDSLTYPFYVINVSDYRIQLANAAARRAHAGGAATCHALTHRLDVPCHTEDHPCPLEIIKQTGRPTVVEHVHYDEKGSPRNMEVHAFPIFDGAGRLAQIIEYCVDITERKQAEETMRRHQLLSEYSRDAILFIRRDDGRILEANRAALSAYGYSHEELLARTVYDLRADEAPAQALDQMIAAETRGLLFETIHRRKDGSTFPVEVSSQGAVIDDSRMLISVVRDVTERKQAEQILRDVQERLRTLAEATFEGICISEEAIIRDCNDQFARMLGYERNELLGRPIAELTSPDVREQVLDGIREGREVFIEHEMLHKNGARRIVEAHGRTVMDKGRPIRITVARDITERKQAEEELRRSEDRFREAFAHAPIGMTMTDLQGRFLHVNEAFCRLTGYDERELLQGDLTFKQLTHPDDLQDNLVVMQQLLTGEIPAFFFEKRYLRKDGQIVWVQVSAGVRRDADGRPFQIVALVEDITPRRQAEEALRRSEQRFKSTFDNAAVGIAHVAMDGRFIRFNNRFCEIVGHPRSELAGLTGRDITQDDDWRAEQSYVQALRDGRVDHYSMEKRYVRDDGSVSWVNLTRSLQRDSEGGPEHYIVIVQDISQRKRLEEELRQLNQRLEQTVQTRTEQLTTTVDRLHEEVARRILAESRLRTRSQMLESFFQHTITPLAFLDRNFNFLRVNEAYAQADEKDPEYFVGKNHFDLFPDPENRAIFEEVVRTKRSYRAYAKPFNYAGASERGTTYWNWQITPLLDEQGQVQSLVFNLEDVTEQQKALREVQERARQLQQLTLELSQAEDRERKRLAEILHDDLQQMLAAAKFNTGLLVNRAKHGEDVQEMASQVKDLLAQAIDKSRSLSHELSPPVLGQSDLCETFEWLAEQVRTKHGLTVHVEACEPVVVHSEPLKGFLFKAAQELLFNVIKHARVKEARLRLRHRRGYILLSIADRGAGFNPQDLDKGGFGLMSIRERVQLLGGTMKIKSISGRGSVFLIKVPDPAAKTTVETPWVGEPSAAKTAAQRKRAEREGEAGLRVLLVDDHKIVREGLEAMLIEEQDIEVIGQAGNGREAVELAQRLEPDVIVMDVSMPVMPGDEATRQIKQALPHIRVIALSMFDDPRTADRMRKAGATAYLLKTAPSEQLLAAIRGSGSPTPAASSA